MLGIDVSSKSLCTALWLDKNQNPRWQKDVPNSLVGVDQLLALTSDHPNTPWVVEPTGRYSLLVVQRAKAAGRTVLLAPPRGAKHFLKSVTERAKTDKLDAKGLALFGLSRRLSEYPLKSEAVDQLDQLLSARKGLSRALMSLRLQAQNLPRAANALTPAIHALEQQIKAADKEIARLSCADTNPQFAIAQKLRQVPGIGAVTAAAVASRLAAKQFSHPDQFVAYIGLDVGTRQSGKRAGSTGLTKQGDAELRRLLFVCAKASLTANKASTNPFREQYERERTKGLNGTAALCAVARKMACVCWSMHKHDSDYDPTRVSTRPSGRVADNGTIESDESNKEDRSLDKQP